MRRQPHDIVEIVRDENQRDVERPAQRVDLVLQAPADARDRRPRTARRAAAPPARAPAPARARRADARRPTARAAGGSCCPDRCTSASSASARARRSARGRCPSAVITLPAAVRCGKSAYSWKTNPTARRCGGANVAVRGVGPRSRRPSGPTACAGRYSPAMRAQDRRLAAAGRPEDGEHVAGVAGELDVERNRRRLAEA